MSHFLLCGRFLFRWFIFDLLCRSDLYKKSGLSVIDLYFSPGGNGENLL